MALRKARRLPRRLNRPVSQKSRTVAHRRQKRHQQFRQERWKRRARRLQRLSVNIQKFTLRWLLAGIALSLLLVLGVLLFSPALALKEITVVRNGPRLNIETVQQALAPLFGRHLLLVTEHEVRTLLEAQVPDLESVTINKQYPAELRVEVTLDPLAAKLLILESDEAEDPELGSGTTITDFVTNEGVYVSAAQSDSDTLPLIRLVDWGARPIPGTQLFPDDTFENLWAAEEALATQFGAGVTHRTVYYRAQEFHMDIGPFELWFDQRSSIAGQLGRYHVFLTNVNPEEVREYVDLRLTDRVVYK